ncbi:MAG: carboxypeptidase-like regulatory domain-containing protein [Tannerellaceae bacterium]|nr:carboxypeptidase-like regulatory domain-containing protein [Tannerellaceae bacterium]
MEFKNLLLFRKMKRVLVCLAFLLPTILYAQTETVSGVVTDAVTGDPLIGVSILQKGTTNGVITDMDGHFTIQVPLNTILSFSYIGYRSQDVTATSGLLTIRLLEDNLDLEEVVVVGYGVQKKINLTGAVTFVKSEDLLKANSANSTNALIGQMPGLIAKQPTGEPGNDNSNL